MVDHTVDTWLMYLAETNYGGGDAGAEYAETVVALVGDLTSFPFPMGEQTLPYLKYERELIRTVGDGAEDVLAVNKSLIKKESTTKHYLQNSAFAIAAISASAGEPGDSFLIHYVKPEGRFEAFGCVVQEYTLEITEFGDFPSESVKWHYYSVKDSSQSVPDLSPTTPINKNQPSVTNDIALTVDAAAVDLKSATLHIINEFEEINLATAWLGKKPALKNRTYELELTFHSYLSNLVDDTRTETISSSLDHDVVITITSFATFTLNNMLVKECNIEHMPEFGLYEYTMTLSMGENFTSSIV